MKSTILLPLWLASLTSGTPLEKRQFDIMATLASLVPEQYILKPSQVQTAKPILRPTAQRKIVRYGPFKLPANKDTGKPMEGHGHGGGAPKAPTKPASLWEELQAALSTLLAVKPMDPNGFSTARMLSPGAMCKDCTVLAGTVEVAFENGTRADIKSGVYLHHAVAVDLSKQVTGFVRSCPGSDQKTLLDSVGTFIGGAVDAFKQFYTTPDGKFNSGYYIKDNVFLMQAEMINYLREEQMVYVQVDLEYLPGKIGGDAGQTVLSALGCSAQPWKPEKNSVGGVKAENFEVYKDGSIILARGHMHDGGTSVSLWVNDKLYCSSKAIYGGEGGEITVDGKSWATISKMTECNEPIPVKKGDKLKIEATYDTKLHPLRESQGEEQENMGMMTMVFANNA